MTGSLASEVTEMPKAQVRTGPRPRQRVQTHFVGESKTEQSHRAEVDINQIVRRAQKTGMLPSNAGSARYGDFSQVADYHTAVDQVQRAEDAFMSLPSHVRKKFANDPGHLLSFLEDPENREEAMELGIIARPLPKPDPAPVANPDLPKKTPEPSPEAKTAPKT